METVPVSTTVPPRDWLPGRGFGEASSPCIFRSKVLYEKLRGRAARRFCSHACVMASSTFNSEMSCVPSMGGAPGGCPEAELQACSAETRLEGQLMAGVAVEKPRSQ